MKLITPSEALTKLESFIKRINRLEENNYTLTRNRTRDLNTLSWDMKHLVFWASIGTHNKNKERAKTVINKTREKYLTAVKFRNNHHEKSKN